MASSQTGAPVTADGVDFIYKDDAGCILLSLFEQVAHPARPHTYEHFDEVRAADREEGNIRLTGDGARQECLAGARGAHKEDSLWGSPAKLLEFLRFLE